MFLVKEIIKNSAIKYVAFFNATHFNLVSNIVDDQINIINVGDAGLIILNSKGIIIEVELLFTAPLFNNYPLIQSKQTVFGTAAFFVDNSKEIIKEPLMYIDQENKKGLLLLNPQRMDVDVLVINDNMRFLLKDMDLVGIEIFDLIYDSDGKMQAQWLEDR